jgi:hypothetical protein
VFVVVMIGGGCGRGIDEAMEFKRETPNCCAHLLKGSISGSAIGTQHSSRWKRHGAPP